MRFVQLTVCPNVYFSLNYEYLRITVPGLRPDLGAMARFRFALLAILALPSAALAQPAPSEDVTVTGTKSREVIANFVSAFAKPTRITGKIARWETAICPVTAGLRPAANDFVTRNLRVVAARAGAPVSDKKSCTPNIAIEFTTKPQALLDDIRKRRASLLGYYDNRDQAQQSATITRPIQSWYATATRALDGTIEADKAVKSGIGLELSRDARGGGFTYPNATANRVTGSHLGDGLRSTFLNVVIIADMAKLADYEIGSIADYIAMLALSQLNSLESCQDLPSIVNMLAAGCERKSDTMTGNDLGYLRGLYKMGSDRTARTQQDEIAYQMEQSLQGH